MVQLRLVADDRRERAREARRQTFLAAASAVIDREGLDGLTMVAVADQLDCAVGTIYTYFPSKAALVAGLQREAIITLLASHAAAQEIWDADLAEHDLDPALLSLVHLLAFGGFFCAASVVYSDEFDLQRALLTSRPTFDDASVRATKEVLDGWFALPVSLLDEAMEAFALDPSDNTERVVRWVAALDGVLLLDNLASVDRYLYRAQHHGRALTADLLRGWGAEHADIAVAGSHVDRLAALGPLAPPVER